MNDQYAREILENGTELNYAKYTGYVEWEKKFKIFPMEDYHKLVYGVTESKQEEIKNFWGKKIGTKIVWKPINKYYNGEWMRISFKTKKDAEKYIKLISA